MSGVVLFPTDFSSNAQQALHFAMDAAARMNCGIALMHCIQDSLIPKSIKFRSQEEKLAKEEVEDIVAEHLQRMIADIGPEGIAHECYVVHGSAAQCITRFCNQNQVNAVVMGTKGDTGLSTILMGSVTASVIRQVDCPVLAIPKDSSIGIPKEIVYATELNFDEEPYFQLATNWAKMYGASITFLHVNDDSNREKGQETVIKKFVSNSSYGKIMYKKIDAKEVLTAINGYLEGFNKDMLILTTHTHSLLDRLFHKSVATEEVLHSQIPVLVFSHRTHDVIFFG